MINTFFRIRFLLSFVTVLFVFSLIIADDYWEYDSALSPDVQFWKSVFTQYQNNQYIIHDSENLSIIYKVFTFDTSFSDYQIEKHLEEIKDDLADKLQEVAIHPDKLAQETAFSRIIYQHFGNEPDPVEVKKASGRIRAQQGMRDSFQQGLERSLHYISFMKEIFKQHKLPEELAYLPHIESSFHPLARSKVGAAGMWQFMRSTGRHYMKINRIIDERFDPFISTGAAARLLKYNYEKLEDWGLAITAYNFGVNGMRRAVKVYGSDYMKVRESFNNRRFKFASRNFYPEFLAVLEIMQDYKKYFPDLQAPENPPVVRYQLKTAVKFSHLARILNLTTGDLKELNPAYSSRVIKGQYSIPSGYWVNVPMESDLVKLEMQISDYVKEESRNIPKSLEKEETTFYLSEKSRKSENGEIPANDSRMLSLLNDRKPGVMTERIKTSQNLTDWEQMFPPASEQIQTFLDQFNAELMPRMELKGDYVMVFGSETLGHFADWLRLPLSHLQKINRLGNRRTIYQGQRLRLDFSRVSKQNFMAYRTAYHQMVLRNFLNERKFISFTEYQVKSGESVWDIAKSHYEVPMELIQYFNLKEDINKLYPGDIIRIPLFQSHIKVEETL